MEERVPFVLEEILEHRSWLLRLARVLVGASSADDLVQETYLTALEKPPRSHSSPRAWLATVLRSKASKHHRTRARVQSRERAAARRDESTESDDAMLERAEMGSRLAAALVSLGDDDRKLLLRRYYAGRSAADIAKELGIPASTVRTQIQRAIERLRSKLSASDPQWRPALVLWLSSHPVPASLTGGVLVKKWLVAAIVLLLVLAGGVSIPELVREDDESTGTVDASVATIDTEIAEPPVTNESSDSGTSTAVVSAGSEGSTPSEADIETEPARVAIVRGRIWRTSGRSLAGGRVVLGTRDEVGALIAEDGTLRMGVSTETDISVALLWRGTRTQVSKVQTRFDSEAVLEIEVDDALGLETRVVDAETGAPIPETVVWIYNSTAMGQAGYSRAVTDAEGRLVASFLPPDEYRLFFDHPDYTQREVGGDPGAIPETIALEPATLLDVQFENWPAGAYEFVQLHFHTAGIRERTGPILNVTESQKNVSTGEFTIRSPGPGLWVVSTLGSGEFPRVQQRIEIDPDAARPSITIELPAPGTIRIWGRVADSMGAPVVGARLEVGASFAVTDDQGRYEILDGRPDAKTRRQLQYGSGNDRIDYPLSPIEITDELDQRMDVALTGASSLDVDLVDLPPESVAEIITAALTSTKDRSTHAVAYWSLGETTRFEHVAPGRYEIQVEVGQLPFDPVIVDVGDGENHAKIEYEEPATIEFVVATPNGTPLPGGVVVGSPVPGSTIEPAPAFHTYVSLRQGLGTATIPPGARAITLTAPGFRRWHGEVDVKPGERTRIEVELAPADRDPPEDQRAVGVEGRG